MPFTVDHKSDPQVIVVTYEPPFNAVQDTTGVAQLLVEELGKSTSDIHFIADFSHIQISFGDLTQGMASAFRDPNSPFANPRLKTYTVGSDSLIQLGAKAAAEQDNYGKAAVKLYSSVDEAMEAVKAANKGN